jgi:RNA polymerase sigma-70 factor, ECF subfamily
VQGDISTNSDYENESVRSFSGGHPRLEGAKTSPDVRTSDEPCPSADLQLVSAVLRKDRKATAELVALHADDIYTYVRHRLIPRVDLVDDVVQEVFLSAWENLDKFRPTASLRSWLLGIARHKVEDYYRERLRAPEPIELADEESPSTPQAVPDFVESLDRESLERKVRRLLAGLPELYALALLWRYWEKRSAREMAAEVGKTEKAVERLLARAREQFRRRWNDE